MDAVYVMLYPTLTESDLDRDGASSERAVVDAGDDGRAAGHERLRSEIMTDDESAHNFLFHTDSPVSVTLASFNEADGAHAESGLRSEWMPPLRRSRVILQTGQPY
jgi:hypothetical protein